MWTYGYNPAGDRISETDPLGNRRTFGYDAAGRTTSETSPRGNVAGASASQYTTTYTYDPLDNLKTRTDPLGHITRYDYDANSNLTSRTDPNQNTTRHVYNDFDERTATIRPDGSTLQTGYDKSGNMTSQTDPAGKITNYGYDALNQVVSETDPLGRQRSYGYDAAGNQTSITDPAGRTTTPSYDDAGQLTGIDYSDPQTADVTYGYDPAGRRTSMTDATGQSTYAYDSLGRLTSHRDGAGRIVGYGYDLNDRQTRITYPAALGGGGGTVIRGYDDAGRLTSVADWRGDVTGFFYDADSNLVVQGYPNQTVSARSYDRAGRLTTLGHARFVGGEDEPPTSVAFVGDFHYGLDPAGRLTAEGATTFGYDANDRLRSQSAAPQVAYEYNGADDPVRATVAGGPAKTQAYDAAHQLTTTTTIPPGGQPQTTTYAYDPNGNRTHDRSQAAAYTYDQADRLTTAQGATYTYNGDGLRTKKTTASATTTHTWDITKDLPEIIGDADSAYITGPDGLPLQQITANGTVRYYHQDRLGSTRAITNNTADVIATYTYDPYGNPTNTTGTITNPFGYAGQYTDTYTGHQYLRARYYDPSTRNFLTRDPLTTVTRAPYNYSNNDPLNHTDPTGLDADRCQPSGSGGGPSAPREICKEQCRQDRTNCERACDHDYDQCTIDERRPLRECQRAYNRCMN